VIVPPDGNRTGSDPVPFPILVQTFALVVASVQQYISPVVLFIHKVPTPPEGFVVITGSDVDLVISVGRLVNEEPEIADKEPENLLAEIPVAKRASVIIPLGKPPEEIPVIVPSGFIFIAISYSLINLTLNIY
jgi:hypothetical protein